MKVIALADQHGSLPDVPGCDLLIVAGDLCPDWFPDDVTAAPTPANGWRIEKTGMVEARRDAARQYEWFLKVWLPWRNRQPAKFCILTWGNHDYCGRQINQRAGSIMLGTNTWAVVDAELLCGPLRVWCTPWSSQYRDWAFVEPDPVLRDVYAAIPTGLDILVSHQPPAGYCDIGDKQGLRGHFGSDALVDAIDQKQPRIVVCGHLHGGYGREALPIGGGATVQVYNVAVLDEAYRVAHAPTVINV